MTNQNYWAKRTAEREAHWHELTTAELTKLRRYYKAAHKELEREAATLYAKYAMENGLTITEARKLIRGDEFKEWRMSLREYVAAAKGDPKLLRELNTLAMRSRISRVEAIHARTLTELIELGNRLQDTTDEHLYRAYLDNYYGTLYDFHKTVGLQTPPAALDRPRVESVLQTKWSGKNYSTRIWTNTRKLATEVQQTILQAIHRGYPIQRLSKNLAQRMNVAYTNAERLILTELNAVETRASADAMKAADFEYYQFVATLDRRTCPICGERDGEVYPLSSMNQGENAPPMHPRCRCTIVASIDDGKQGRKTTDQRAAEGRTRVPADMSYRDWRAVYIDKSKTLAQWQAEQAARQKENLPARNYNSVIAQKFGKMHYDNIRDILENAENKKAAQVWTKIEDQIQIDPLPLKKALQAYHSGGVVHINIDYEEHDRRYMAPYQAVFHEVGHFIDWLKSQIVSGKREYFSLRYEQNAFVKAIDKDFDALVAAKKAEIQKSRLARIDELKTLIARRDWNEMWIQGFCTTRDSFELEFYFNREPDKAQRGLARILKGTVDNDTALKAIAKDFMTAYPDLRDRVDWGDIFNGYTKGEYDVGIAHKKSYWKGDPNTRPKEAFAEFFSAAIANPKSYAVLKKHLPTAEKFFCDMLDELLAGL